MTDLSDVKTKFVNILKADSTLASLFGNDAAGNVPIYQEWPLGKMLWLLIVTVSDIVDNGEVSALNDAFDGTKRYEWDNALVQVDVWVRPRLMNLSALKKKMSLQRFIEKNPKTTTNF